MTSLRTDGADVYSPTPEDTPWHRMGGTEAVKALAEAFYDDMEIHEPELTATHQQEPPGKVSRRSRDRFGLFLVMWLGGPQEYMEKHGHPRLRMRHSKVPIGVDLRDAWLRSMSRAMDARQIDGRVRMYLNVRFAEVADFLRNVDPTGQPR